MDTIFLDLETTGLDPIRDEILEIGILDDTGAILLDSLVCPTRHRTWPAAQRINGIDPADVSGSPTLAALRPRLVEAVAGTRARGRVWSAGDSRTSTRSAVCSHVCSTVRTPYTSGSGCPRSSTSGSRRKSRS